MSPTTAKRRILPRNRWWLGLAITATLATVLLTGCSPDSRERILPTIFDGVVPDRPPPTRRVRRDLLREIDELNRELVRTRAEVEAAKAAARPRGPDRPELPAEQARTWEEAAALLPKVAGGGVDWIQALEDGSLAPRPGLDASAPEQAVLEFDVELEGTASELFSVTYAHAPHTRWLACRNCHPGIFPLERGAERPAVTMATIREGQACGVCHGSVAFGLEGGCARCHPAIPAESAWRPTEEPKNPVEGAPTFEEAARLLPATEAGAPDWVKAVAEEIITPRPGIDAAAEDQDVLPLDVELVPEGNEMFKTIFPHEAHTALLSCDSCHPEIFEMEAGKTPITMDAIFAGEYCGRCHGKVAFDVAAGCPRCHPALAGG